MSCDSLRAIAKTRDRAALVTRDGHRTYPKGLDLNNLITPEETTLG
jgi:hypothetical protein